MDAENNNAPSLQDAFARFQRERKEEHRARRRRASRPTAESKARLRALFVETARKYMGVPYARKYASEADQDAPLFLDCCGLVRRVAWDLQDELGFRLGKWNQAYQFDTLPVALSGPEEMQPGDLVFYTGEYFSERAKPQKHSMVHVEIFVGGESGEATIGARWKRGHVQQFDSFRFESQSYHSVQHHFRSLDTWLEGECRSHCAEHDWLRVRSPGPSSSKYSVFNPDDADSSDEEAAEDSDCDGEGEVEEAKWAPPRRFYVNRANGWRLVKSALEARGWEQTEDPDDADFGLRWVERRSQIDYARLRPGQLACHIPNNDVITTKLGLLVAMRKEYGEAPEPPVSLDAVLRPLVTAACLLRPRNVANFMLMELYGGSTSSAAAATAAAGDPDEVAAYMAASVDPVVGPLVAAAAAAEPANVPDFCASWLEQLVGGAAPDAIEVPIQAAPEGEGGMPAFMPESYRLDHASDCVKLLRRHDALPADEAVWIFKPTVGNRGMGLFVFRERDVLVALTQQLAESSTDHDTVLADAAARSPELAKALQSSGRQPAIVQRYTTRPLLFDGRFKFDIRMYCLIARTQPSFAVYGYDEGYLRLSLVPYSLEDLADRTVHLTNAAVQKKHAAYKAAPGANIKSLEDLAALVGAARFEREVRPAMQQAMAAVVRAGVPDFERGDGYFDLLGFDFLLTDDCRLQLLEVNTNPALHIDCPLHERILPALVRDTVDVVLGLHREGKGEEEAAAGGFSLLFTA